MKIILGIIAFHLLIIMRTNLSGSRRLPYIAIIVITLLMVVFVLFMMYTMERP